MENDKGELVDLYVLPSHTHSFPLPPHPTPQSQKTPQANILPPFPTQLRPAQMLRDEPHHQSQRPRLGPDLRGQGGRERAVHGGEPGVRAVRVRAGHGRGRRQSESVGAAGRAREECLERELAAVEVSELGRG